MGLSLPDKKELESILKIDARELDKMITFSRKLVPSQGSLYDFIYGLVVGMILGNYLEKFFLKYKRDPDNDELIDIYFTLSLRSPKIRKLILSNL
ncbi:MAG: hypothetical protein ACM31J_05265 [Nitrososphaerales archaeon]